MSLKVVLSEYLQADNKRDVKIYINRNGQKRYYSLDIPILEDQFDPKPGRLKEKKHPNADLHNATIRDAFSAFERLIIKYPGALSSKIIKLYEAESKAPKVNGGTPSLLKFIEQTIELAKEGRLLDERTGKPIVKNTWKGYGNLLSRLKLFSDHVRYVDFEDIDMNFYSDYMHFLRFKLYTLKDGVGLPLNPPPAKNKTAIGLAENSMGTDIKNLKKMMNLAGGKGYTANVEHKKAAFKTIEEEVDTIALSKEEIERMFAVDCITENQHLLEEQDRAISIFNFLLRFNDSIQIDESNLVKEGDRLFMSTKTSKTGERVLVPIMARTLGMLKRNNFKIPSLTNQEANWKLKELGRLAKINDIVATYENRAGERIKTTQEKWKLIGTHTLRRTAATLMWIAGIPINIIMELGGWKTEEEFFKYIKARKLEAAKIAASHPYFN